jgi:choline dehydrogenase-like flavoprotein
VESIEQGIVNQNDMTFRMMLRGVGEMEGTAGRGTSYVDNSAPPDPNDVHGVRRAYVNLEATAGDRAFWTEMDLATCKLAAEIAGDNPVKFLDADLSALNGRRPEEFEGILNTLIRNKKEGWRDTLGLSHHEGGTLYMGTRGDGSITDTYGRFHHLENTYVVGPALFPTIGSANPVLTGLTLTRRTAQSIVDMLRARGPQVVARAATRSVLQTAVNLKVPANLPSATGEYREIMNP